MTVVKELNELAEKMTGVNPKAKTDQQALNYIEQHYQGGQPSPTPQSYDYVIPLLYIDFTSDNSTISDSNVINVINEISEELSNGLKPLKIGMYLHDTDTDNEYFLNVDYCIDYNYELSLYSSLGINYDFHIYNDGTNWVVGINHNWS